MQHPSASPDGYIIDQNKTADLAYGHATSDYSGCGWIAVYNLLRATGKERPARQVSEELATGWFHGRMGTGPLRLKRYLLCAGFSLQTALTRKKALQLAQGAHSGILMYMASVHGLHYVAFVRQENGLFRFFNAEMGHPAHCSTLEEFFHTYVKGPFAYTMVTE